MVVVTAEARESTVDCEKPLRMAMCGHLDRQSLLLSTVDPPSITLGAGGSCRAPQKQWGELAMLCSFENVTFLGPRPTQACTTPI